MGLDLEAEWQPIHRDLDHHFVIPVFAMWNALESPRETLRFALNSVTYRGSALRFLLISPDDHLGMQVFETLVDQASVGHSDIGLVRRAIKALPRKWVIEHIQSIVIQILDDEECGEFYRRFAELYEEIDDQLLGPLIQRASRSNDPETMEVVEDYRDKVSLPPNQSD